MHNKANVLLKERNKKTLVIIKHGSYFDAYNRIVNDGVEFYHAEKFWHEFIEELSLKYEILVVSLYSNEHDVILPNGVRSIGVNLRKSLVNRIVGYARISRLIINLNPYYIVNRNTDPVLLFISLIKSKALLPMFADSFNVIGMKSMIRAKILKYILNRQKIRYVSNHNIAACLSLSSLGIRKEKIIPWDWYYNVNNTYPVKSLTDQKSPLKLIYVGRLTHGKGVGEIIEAARYYNDRELYVTIVGEGRDYNHFINKTRQLRLEQTIRFLGKVENKRIIELMRSHDVVVVPSRKSEAEGLPITIYEALISKTPLICSNHPMFAFYLNDGINATIFKESDPYSLSERIQKLTKSPTVYRAISTNSHKTLKAIICPVKIDKIILNWLQGENDWFEDKTLKVLCKKKCLSRWVRDY